jgi:3-hydroxyacyl-CoA dehydrogenase
LSSQRQQQSARCTDPAAASAAGLDPARLARIDRHLQEQYIDKGKLGTTTGEGFYTY